MNGLRACILRGSTCVLAVLVTWCASIGPANAQRSPIPEALGLSDIAGLDADTERVSSPFAGLLVTPHGARNTHDPGYGGTYNGTVAAYTADQPAGHSQPDGYLRRFIVHVPEADALPAARSAARILLTLLGQMHRHTGYDHPASARSLDVWLTAGPHTGVGGDIGGEQRGTSIYVFALSAERTPLEWLRELAHEYGHFALPGIAGYTAPEEWANGLLGERLFLKWLAEDLGAGTLAATQAPYLDVKSIRTYVEKQVVPLINRIARAGADPRSFRRRDAEGMDTFTALALYTDTVYGSTALWNAFSYTSPQKGPFPTGPDFYTGVTGSLQSRLTLRITPPVSPAQGAGEAFYAWLPRGDFASARSPGSAWKIAFQPATDGRDDGSRLTVNRADWVKIRVRSAAASPALTLRRLGAEVP